MPYTQCTVHNLNSCNTCATISDEKFTHLQRLQSSNKHSPH